MNVVGAPVVVDLLRQSMAQGQTPFLTVSSSSMTPLLRTGDQIGLEPITPQHLRVGDIVTLVNEADLLTHRFWGWENGRLRTRGDRPLQFDPLWLPDKLLGRVVVPRRSGRSFSLTSGRGQRLNCHLSQLVLVEGRLMGQKWAVRLIHRANFVWASLLTRIVF